MSVDHSQLRETLRDARARLLAELGPGGHFRGELSSSALSTATAAFALTAAERAGRRLDVADQRLVRRGLDWLAAHANADGGWGDTSRSASNPSTTALCWAALSAGARDAHQPVIERARDWIRHELGSVEPENLKAAIAAVYGEDRTFSVPILTMCALAGCLGPLPDAFRGIPALPFELAALPQRLFRYLGLPVVSYALPALIAIGQVQHHHLPSARGLPRRLRERTRERTLDRLERIQPSSGGFLEAVPLTAFVTMSLAGAGRVDHPVTDRALAFLRGAARADGSWPIDVDLATWLTTLSVQALSASDGELRIFDPGQRRCVREWLLDQQFREIHPYTGASPGGWAWTDLPGGVPDADDTAGALLALRRLGESDARTREAAEWGVRWLLGLQNRDGGIPTFCRGWGKLPFDRSAPDLTAHALRAFRAWRDQMPPALVRRLDRAMSRGHRYLRRTQRGDGSWVPLWFGNQDAPRCENPTYGTSRVLLALGESAEAEAGSRWLLAAQNADGGWGGAVGVASSLEETALALDALARPRERACSRDVDDALTRGTAYLLDRLAAGDDGDPAPIGFYFAKLWYFEKLYPRIFSVATLGRLASAAPTTTRREEIYRPIGNP